MAPAAQRFLACFGNGFAGRLGLGPACRSEAFPRLVGSLVGYSLQQVACGGAHTAVASGAALPQTARDYL